MNIEKLRKKSATFHRKQRRRLCLKAYKELRNEILKEARRGKLCVKFSGRFNYEYAVAARLLYRKNKGFNVRVRMEDTRWNNEFKTNEIFISWDKDKAPLFEEIITFNIDEDKDEDDDDEL